MPQALERADGSWAWVVLLASLVTQALTLAFPMCIGVFFTELQHDFQASNSETSWLPSIMGSMLHAGGPLCSILVGRFGCRVTMMLGGVLSSLGMVASSFSRTLVQLFLTAGLITGDCQSIGNGGRSGQGQQACSPPRTAYSPAREADNWLVLDSTDNFSYVFYMSSFFLITSALFMGGSFYSLQKRERKGKQDNAKGDTSETVPVPGLILEDRPKRELCTESMYVTSV
ncbi:PREDICTED: monocarboxylate transporter 6 [Dipodomys ordii]|uniref:Monocarboxylate transporter 6 n=1 Tax=Dipodomys ordii TaxID=10020 RepID=A0A1S3GUJ2_DIPOR|nr:PREDICTED: monocarboxylate transporter 6 [Dipodomys ordii]